MLYFCYIIGYCHQLYLHIVGNLKLNTMRIYKKQFITDLDSSLFLNGEIIITKSDNLIFSFELNKFEGNVRGKDENLQPINLANYTGLALFRTLGEAVSFANYYESGTYNYEYYVQKINPDLKQGGRNTNPDIDVMGDLAWQLCTVYDNYSIYKRINVSGVKWGEN